MKINHAVLMGFALVWMVIVSACGAAPAAGAKISTEDVWARPSMAAKGEMMGTVSGVFMKIKNDGAQADRLVGAKSDVAKMAEIHETVLEGEVAKMQKLSNGLEIPASSSVELKPGGYHVMLINLNKDLMVGEKIMLELEFEKSGKITVEVEVKDPAAIMP